MSKKSVLPVLDKGEARRRGRNGGIASGKARQKRKELRELLEAALSLPDAGRDMSNAEAIAAALVEKAKAGDVRAFEAIRDTVGEKPVNRLDHTSTDGSLTPAPRLDLAGLSIDDLIRLTREAFAAEVAQ